MINFIPLTKFLDYKTEDSINYYVGFDKSPSDPDLVVDENFFPNSVIMDVWESSAKSSKDWDNFKKLYQYQLHNDWQAKRFLKTIELMDSNGKVVNVVCTCSNHDRCIRSIMAEELDGIAMVNLV